MPLNEDADLTLLLDKIYRDRNFDLREYKKASLKRRIEKRLRAHKVGSYKDYIQILDTIPDEYERLLDVLTINVTGFFRDPDIFTAIEQLVIRKIISAKESSKDRTIRIWSAGCSSGEEPYSIAIILMENLKGEVENYKIYIFSTDIDRNILIRARKGEYKQSNLSGVRKELLDKYFTCAYGTCKIIKQVRDLVIFGTHNIVSDPPISHLDFLICRNVLIYFSRDLQDRIFMSLHYALERGGFLTIGSSEVISGEAQKFFKQIGKGLPIYEKI